MSTAYPQWDTRSEDKKDEIERRIPAMSMLAQVWTAVVRFERSCLRQMPLQTRLRRVCCRERKKEREREGEGEICNRPNAISRRLLSSPRLAATEHRSARSFSHTFAHRGNFSSAGTHNRRLHAVLLYAAKRHDSSAAFRTILLTLNRSEPPIIPFFSFSLLSFSFIYLFFFLRSDVFLRLSRLDSDLLWIGLLIN